jgi:ABC-type nitrate/sulfonate/bicarbonate transport system ATPase subunit
MAPWSRGSPDADPSNLWGNAREGSAVPTRAQQLNRPSTIGEPQVDAARTVAEQTEAEIGDGILLHRVGLCFTDRSGRAVEALRDVSLHAREQEVLAVVGPSGCGKTTLLELICGLQVPDTGSVQAAPAALMPQRDLLLPWRSALDNAALPLQIAGLPRKQARAQALPLFRELGLDGFEQAHPSELSGGMRQRVAFLRTLLSGKRVLCLDEPFGALDAITRMQMQSWLAKALAHEPRTVVLVTHDVEEAVLLGDRVAVMSPRPGRVIQELEVEMPRPRNRVDEHVAALRERALGALGAQERP